MKRFSLHAHLFDCQFKQILLKDLIISKRHQQLIVEMAHLQSQQESGEVLFVKSLIDHLKYLFNFVKKAQNKQNKFLINQNQLQRQSKKIKIEKTIKKNQNDQYIVKRKKNKKNNQIPKKPLSSFVLYLRDQIKSGNHPSNEKQVCKLAKIVSQQWKQLSLQMKQPYEQRSIMSKQKYQQQLKEFIQQNAEEYQRIQNIKKKKRQLKYNQKNKNKNRQEKARKIKQKIKLKQKETNKNPQKQQNVIKIQIDKIQKKRYFSDEIKLNIIRINQQKNKFQEKQNNEQISKLQISNDCIGQMNNLILIQKSGKLQIDEVITINTKSKQHKQIIKQQLINKNEETGMKKLSIVIQKQTESSHNVKESKSSQLSELVQSDSSDSILNSVKFPNDNLLFQNQKTTELSVVDKKIPQSFRQQAKQISPFFNYYKQSIEAMKNQNSQKKESQLIKLVSEKWALLTKDQKKKYRQNNQLNTIDIQQISSSNDNLVRHSNKNILNQKRIKELKEFDFKYF